MKNVLIPTDYTVASLELAEKTARCLAGESLHITLFHAFEIPFFASDIIRPESQPHLELLNDTFRQACRRLKQQHPRTIRSINVRHLYGNSNAVFRNFTEAHDIDLIVHPDYYVFRRVHPQSVDPTGMFRHARLPLLKSLLPAKKHSFTEKQSLYVAERTHSLPLHLREDKV